MKKRLLLMFFLAGTTLLGWAQNEKKFSPGVWMAIENRDGKISFGDNSSVVIQEKNKALNATTTGSIRGTIGGTEKNTQTTTFNVSEQLPTDVPTEIDGVEMLQCWINMSDANYSELEKLGVTNITEFISGKVSANVPVDALEGVAALENVVKINAAKKLAPTTYYARQKTNVDDVIYFSNEAQTAGLLQAYNGQNVVLGIIDTGIQFNHVMFKDSEGNTRIKKAYVYNTTTSTLDEYAGSAIESLTYDIANEDHGTHTSSIAGGSDYEFTGYYYDNEEGTYKQGTRTYGGMAPGTDLVLCGLGGKLTDVNISTCIKNISDYADEVNKPCVISISLGSQAGPHDGTGDMADVCAQYTGEGKVILYAASNDGGTNIYLHGGNVTQDVPLLSLLNCTSYDGYTNRGYTYNNYILVGGAISYAREKNVELAVRAYVVNTSNNQIVWMSNEITQNTQIRTSTQGAYGGKLSNFFNSYGSSSAYLGFYFDTLEDSQKNYIETVVNGLQAKSYTTTDSENKIRTGDYKIGISIYPKQSDASVTIDSWGFSSTYFDGGTATYNNATYTFVAGNDNCSVSDESTYPSVIPVGAYVSGKGWVASDGYVYTLYDEVDDIASFSSWSAEGSGPLGISYPFITAPGEVIISGFNTGDVANQESYLIYGYDEDNPIGAMSGTSMATPCAAGIVALWMQADPTLTPEKVKEVMAATAISDSHTQASAHFGPNGKIDALAGLEYILSHQNPELITDPEELVFSTTAGTPQELSFDLLGANLHGDVSLTLTDESGVFSLSASTVSQADAEEGASVTVTFNPTAIGSYTGTITLSTQDLAEDVTVALTASATGSFDVTISQAGVTTLYLDFPVIIPFDTYDELFSVSYVYKVENMSTYGKRLDTVIPANTGVIIAGNPGVYTFQSAVGDLNGLAPSDMAKLQTSPNRLAGCTEATVIADNPELKAAQDANQLWTLQVGTEYIMFKKFTGTTLAANKCYLIYDAGPEDNTTKGMSLFADDGETAIRGIQQYVVESDEWYNLQGIRLTGKPSQKGLYIHNGRVVTVK